jgi:UDP-N-acetylmuramate--alanine ligase
MFLKPQQLHFTGIGGIGMSGIAEILLNLGYQITGSDLKLSPITERLQSLGAKIYEGHAAENVQGAKALVVTSAVDGQNPELLEARRLGIPIIPRGELLAELMRLKYGIAIAGSHGENYNHFDGGYDSVACRLGSDGCSGWPRGNHGRVECPPWQEQLFGCRIG